MKKKYKKHKQGQFHPKNKDKYSGSLPIYFRSSWERRVMFFFDNCDSCISWGSESVAVRYYDPIEKRIRRYFIDFNASFKDKNGNIARHLIEIKPEKETKPPKQTLRKKRETFIKEQKSYLRNKAKWESAKKWCDQKGYKFIILTEKELFTDDL